MSDSGASCCLCSKDAKYRCPSCQRMTCSLTCVNEHKKNFNCSGRREVPYVPISEMNTESFRRDVALLDEAARVIESTSRAFVQRQLEAAATASKRVKIGALRKSCIERNIQLLSCPPMLHRHLKNYSNVRKSNVYWSVEWYFVEKDIVLYERRVNERLIISQTLERVLHRGPMGQLTSKTLEDYTLLEKVVVLLRDLDSPDKNPCYFLCDIEASIRDNLSNTKVLEFPKFYVALKKNLDLYNVVQRRKVEVKTGAEHAPVEGASDLMDVSVTSDVTAEQTLN